MCDDGFRVAFADDIKQRFQMQNVTVLVCWSVIVINYEYGGCCDGGLGASKSLVGDL